MIPTRLSELFPGPGQGGFNSGMANLRRAAFCFVALGSIGSAVSFVPLQHLANYPSLTTSDTRVTFVRDAPRHSIVAPNLRNKVTPRHLTIDQAELNQRIAKFYDER
jgi:hypothetical protein